MSKSLTLIYGRRGEKLSFLIKFMLRSPHNVYNLEQMISAPLCGRRATVGGLPVVNFIYSVFFRFRPADVVDDDDDDDRYRCAQSYSDYLKMRDFNCWLWLGSRVHTCAICDRGEVYSQWRWWRWWERWKMQWDDDRAANDDKTHKNKWVIPTYSGNGRVWAVK